MVAGAYIAWFWAANLRSGAGATGATGRLVESTSQRAVQFAGDHWAVIGLALTALVTAVVLRLLLHEPTPGPESGPAPADGPDRPVSRRRRDDATGAAPGR